MAIIIWTSFIVIINISTIINICIHHLNYSISANMTNTYDYR